MSKQYDLFGDEVMPEISKRTKREVFEDYDSFVAKFKAPTVKTTDECYTPQHVYAAVLEWLGTKVDLTGRCIVRPFYPGGDFEKFEYPDNCVVVDNPPFSILAKIIRFYLAAKIDYFLFAPGLTLFTPTKDARDCAIVTGTPITYANGAVVLTGFHSSLFPGTRVLLAGTLHHRLRAAQNKAPRKAKGKAFLPANVETAALLHAAITEQDYAVPVTESAPVSRLDSGKALFGGGGIYFYPRCPRYRRLSRREGSCLQ